jgi:uncharacterized protein YecT (DUF1311 family)
MTRKLALCFGLAVAAVCAWPAAAQSDVDSYYSKTFNDCMDQAGGSTMPMRDCQDAEFALWDKALNDVYKTLMASRPAAAKTQLRDEERAWLASTKKKCDHAGDGDAGGTAQNIEIQGCYLEETVRRTVYLRGLH